MERVKFFTTKQAAEIIGCSVSTLHKLTMNRAIEFYKPNGGKIYFSIEQIKSYVQRGRIKSKHELEGEINYESM